MRRRFAVRIADAKCRSCPRAQLPSGVAPTRHLALEAFTTPVASVESMRWPAISVGAPNSIGLRLFDVGIVDVE